MTHAKAARRSPRRSPAPPPAEKPPARRGWLARDWRKILRHSWSARILMIAGVLSAAEIGLQLAGEQLPVSGLTRALITAAVVGAAFVARLLAQKAFDQ